MVMASGTNFGLLRTLPHIAGIVIGVTVMYLVVGLVGQPLVANSYLAAALRAVGVLYLLWLAYRLANTRAKPRPTAAASAAPVDSKSKPLNFWQAAAFQWVNPQAWLSVGSALVTYTFVDGTASKLGAVLLAMMFGLVALPVVTGWTLLGVGASRILQRQRSIVIFNRCMALLVVASLIPIVMPMLSSH